MVAVKTPEEKSKLVKQLAAMVGVAILFALLMCVGCGSDPAMLLSASQRLPEENTTAPPEGFTLLARFAHISDTHMVDEESPGRLTVASRLTRSAWRPYEAYATQLLDGTIRTINKRHASGMNIDFVIHTGDGTDNAQRNELGWLVTAFDGGLIDPRTGPDDRAPASLPDPALDPHYPFTAQGLYRNGRHGSKPTIPWYTVFGNHDRFGVGVFPIINGPLGARVSPLPLPDRLGIVAPLWLNPEGALAWAPITPANLGPPPRLNTPTRIEPNPNRRYITNEEFITALLGSTSAPAGHGFDAAHPNRTWYSVSPVPGLRLIGLNSASPALEIPEQSYAEGAISPAERDFLRASLQRAQDANEIVILATHHPSDSLSVALGTALTGRSLRSLLRQFPCVALHVAGHIHKHAAMDRGGYAELVVGSIIDAPHQGRIIEIWRKGSEIALRYRFFSHLDEIEPPPGEDAATLFDDPLLPIRRVAAELAGATH